ncbi:MAG: DUF3299 domain-containing protein [Gammaproteobacteria bacterium]
MLSLAVSASDKEPQELMWDEMVPPEELNMMPPSPYDESPEALTFGTQPVTELDGKYVKVPGFIVPLESDEGGVLSEFLLVPYFGACIHTPPPPPNQIVYIKMKEPVEVINIWDPYWIIGTMKTDTYSGDIAEAVYQVAGDRIEKYEY